MIRTLVFGALLVLAAGPATAAGRYSADRYDSRIEVLRGGTLRVTESITIRFETGSFSQFYRAIPRRMTDGIEIESASMDGAPMPRGSAPGQIQISSSSNVRVTWRFAVTAPATHTFELTYLAQGVARQEADADVVAWNVLPVEHSYRIASSTMDMTLPEAPSGSPSIEARRIGATDLDVDGRHLRIDASAIGSNGWFQASVRLPRNSILDAPPLWQQQRSEVERLSIRWVYAGAIVFIAGLAVLFFVRQQYDPPVRESVATTASPTAPPDTLPPAIAGTLLANGSPRLEHAMATVFVLADRGELRIDEQSRVFGLRNFTITSTPKRAPLALYEERLLEIIFAGKPEPTSSVTLGKVRNRIVGHLRQFNAALEPALVSAGLLDEDRRAVRRRFVVFSVGCLIGAGIAAIALSLVVTLFGGWPMLIPLALALVGVVGLICYAAHTPLSNDGIRRATEWRGFRRYLRDIARDRQPSPGDGVLKQLLPFAIAFGIAHVWSAFLKRHRAAAPAWFRAASDSGGHGTVAFAAFVGAGGSAASGHGGAGAAGAAGGGSSGAS